jgi:hypothetical protein
LIMARSAVVIQLGQEGLGQQAAGDDHVSGMVFYGTAPGSFNTTRQQAVFSVADAESKGLTNDYSDETPARAIVTITGTPAEGETLTLTVTVPVPATAANPTGVVTVTLGTGTAPATPTVTTYAAAVVAAINALTYSHGYTASNSSGVITVIAAPGLGVCLNTGTPLAVSSTGSGSSYAITQQFGTGSGGATAGVASKKALWHYHVSQFFRQNPGGVLWLGFFNSVSSTYADIVTLANAAKGAIKQMGVYDNTAVTAANISANSTKMQARCVDLFAGYLPLGALIYTPNVRGTVNDITTLENEQTLSNYYVTVDIAQDGEAQGAGLYITSGMSVGTLGTALGVLSRIAVNQNLGEIGTCNVSDGTELAVPAFINAQKVSALASSALDQLDTYRYLFFTTMPNITGTFYNNDWTNIVQTSPYYRISRNRVMSKAVRLCYAALVPLLKSQIELNTDGTITDVSVAKFQSAVIPVGAQMRANSEISNMRVTVDPAQNVIATGKVIVAVGIQPTVTADFIYVPIAFKANLA